MSVKNNFNKDKNKENNTVSKDRKEWSHEWGLEKQTEGLDKRSVAKQHKIGEEMKKEAVKHPQKTQKNKK